MTDKENTKWEKQSCERRMEGVPNELESTCTCTCTFLVKGLMQKGRCYMYMHRMSPTGCNQVQQLNQPLQRTRQQPPNHSITL